MAVMQLKDGRWICYYRVPLGGQSKIKREYFGRGPQGEEAARKRDDELGLKRRRPRNEWLGPTFGELADEYGRRKDFNWNSLVMLSYRLFANILPVFRETPAIKITHQALDRYVAQRRRKVKSSTVRREITDIKAILSWATRQHPPLIHYNPVRDYRPPRPDDAVILPPTPDEAGRILDEAAPHLYRAIFLSYYLGLRPGAVELLSLKWDNVLWNSRTIMVFSADKGGPPRREVPIHPDLLRELKKWHAEDKGRGPIIHYRGRAVKRIHNAWRGALKRAGITRRLRMYDLRHHFVTASLEQGADLNALAEIVGSRPETIMRTYQHVSTSLRRRTVSKIPSLPASPKTGKKMGPAPKTARRPHPVGNTKRITSQKKGRSEKRPNYLIFLW